MNELETLYQEKFSLGSYGDDISKKFALISFICFLYKKLREKKPDVTYYQIIYKVADGIIPIEEINKLAVICEDFGYGCKEFPLFGIEPKEVPNKIKEILLEWLPF